MLKTKVLSIQNLSNFNFEETKRNVNDYFKDLERLQWEWEKLNAQKGLIANYDFTAQYSQPYNPIGQDEFDLSAKENKEEQLKKCLSNYYWAKNILSDTEQLYLYEYFINRKYENEIIDLLGFSSNDSREFRQLKKSAIYKFADFLNLLVEKGGIEK